LSGEKKKRERGGKKEKREGGPSTGPVASSIPEVPRKKGRGGEGEPLSYAGASRREREGDGSGILSDSGRGRGKPHLLLLSDALRGRRKREHLDVLSFIIFMRGASGHAEGEGEKTEKTYHNDGQACREICILLAAAGGKKGGGGGGGGGGGRLGGLEPVRPRLPCNNRGGRRERKGK